MTRIPNSARIRSLQSEKEMLVLELEDMKCKPQRLGLSFSVVFEIFNAQEEYTPSIKHVRWDPLDWWTFQAIKRREGGSREALAWSVRSWDKAVNRASNAILGTGTCSPHCSRVWTFQDHISGSITRVILGINAFKHRFVSIRHW